MKPIQGYEPGEIYSRLNSVMQDVGAVAKNDKNTHQNFRFRGIDAVVNAVYPAFVKHGLVCVPQVLEHEYETVTVGAKGTAMGRVSMLVSYRIFAPDGSSVSGEVRAEAMDSGDKATAKCMSVAYRTFLLQTLCLPTDEPDPDHDTYERSPKQEPARPLAKPVSKNDQFQPAKHSPLSKAQRMLIERQTANRIGGTLTAISDVLGRVVKSLDDVDQSEFRTIVNVLNMDDTN